MQAIVLDDAIQVSIPVLNVKADDHVCMNDHTDSTTRHFVDHILEEPNMIPSSVVQEPTMSSTIGKRQSTRTSRPPLWQKDFVTSAKSISKPHCLYSLGDNSLSDSLLSDIGAYQRLFRRLIYLTITRFDFSCVVQSLSQFMNAPKRSHMDAVVSVVRYIKQNRGSGIYLAAQSSDSLQAYCDADWGSCLDTRKSITSQKSNPLSPGVLQKQNIEAWLQLLLKLHG
uniref:Reverse transcriptase Ty1/copia-type domain-containing protein n=1 Tax=Solanum lycopersicum TaxID=4081 RepID=A0A3Q7GKH7_SOLLC